MHSFQSISSDLLGLARHFSDLTQPLFGTKKQFFIERADTSSTKGNEEYQRLKGMLEGDFLYKSSKKYCHRNPQGRIFMKFGRALLY